MVLGGIGGIGSGIDVKGIVKAMVDAERAPKKAQLDRLERNTTTQISALGQFRSALTDFQNSLKSLNDPAIFEKRTATSSKTDIFTATASADASAANYSVQVFNLAQSSRVALAGVDAPDQKLGTGTMTLSVGDKTLTIEVDETNNTLAGLRKAINDAGSDLGLSASIVNDPGGEGGARLVLSSDIKGAGKDIEVAISNTGPGSEALQSLAFTAPETTDFAAVELDPGNPRGARVISFARDANIAVDGIAISSASNTIEGVIEGVTLNLKAAQSAEAIANADGIGLRVGEDRAGVRSQVNKFVESYNKLMETVKSLTLVTPVGGDDSQPLAAPLVGDASVRNVQTALRNQLASVQGEGGLRLLSDLGISTQRDGTLEVDGARLEQSLDRNFDELAAFFHRQRWPDGAAGKSCSALYRA